MRGCLIVLEGGDRCGKTTLSQMLVERIPNAVLFRFPDRTTGVGSIIGNYLAKRTSIPDEGIHLLMAANRWERCPEIKEALRAGKTVICDRYCYSGVAYSMAKEGGWKSRAWYRAPDRGLPQPDMVLYLDIDPEEAAQRDQYGKEIYESIQFQTRVRREYELLRDEDAADEHETTWTTIDAGGGKSLYHLEEELLQRLEGRTTTEDPLGRIWMK